LFLYLRHSISSLVVFIFFIFFIPISATSCIESDNWFCNIDNTLSYSESNILFCILLILLSSKILSNFSIIFSVFIFNEDLSILLTIIYILDNIISNSDFDKFLKIVWLKSILQHILFSKYVLSAAELYTLFLNLFKCNI
jgi:hypothetical protein